MRNNKRREYSVRLKLVLVFLCTTLLIAVMNIVMYYNLQGTISKIDTVYVSNEKLNELLEGLDKVQNNVYLYLNTKSSDALEDYYRYEQEYQGMIKELNQEATDNPVGLLEKNIYNMSSSYLDSAADTVEAKRARNIQRFKAYFVETERLYADIELMIRSLNNIQFQNNSQKYIELRTTLNLLVGVSAAILIGLLVVNVFFVLIMTRSITYPLVELARSANQVAEGDFNAAVPYSGANDELGAVSRAFNKMVGSVRNYIEQIQENHDRETQMIENELSMKNDLKEAQLKYLQAQINPHFLFNTLNAGAQLAMMEGAEKTCLFVENMADFFRYNVHKMNNSTTINEEIQLVDNYIYILNVRFSGEIHFQKQIDQRYLQTEMPGMILQPIVENAVNHGIRGVEWEGHINLIVYEEKDHVCISIRDNGKGMTAEMIKKLMHGEKLHNPEDEDTTGIGMDNVVSRLRRFYEIDDVVRISSDGEGMGTEVTLLIPLNGPKESAGYV